MAQPVLINEIMYHPSSENDREEYIELFNCGPAAVDLTGWKFSKGVQFTFPKVAIPSGGYLVVAADLPTFAAKYSSVTNVVGGWTGRLSNSRNVLKLDDAAGNLVDSVSYADEGDWAARMKGPLDHNHRGWTWFAKHDGLGKSLELINPDLPNDYGQNWASSLVTNGTPGAANSVLRTNIAPLILDVRQFPPIPRSVDSVLVTARLLDEHGSNLTATLNWRLDGAGPAFTSAAMYDDGLHDDGSAGDGTFAASIPPQPNNAIVEFYVEASDPEDHSRTWPAPAIDTNGASLGQAANALYQVDDSAYTGAFPLYKLIMKEADRAELAAIGSANNGDQNSDAEMNGTFINVDGAGTEVRYPVGIRNRGHGSRNRKPNNYRIAFRSDAEWKGVTALNLNGQYTHAQLIGSVLALKSGVGGAFSRPVQVRVNNVNLANNGPQTYGGMYVANEVVNSDWAENWFPADSSGNIYRGIRDLAPSDFNYRGALYTSYTNTWFKKSNTSENDWTDLIGMLRVMGTNDLFTTDSVRGVIHAEQWLNYIAVMALFDNEETTINTAYNDDYFLYAGVSDPRFYLMYYDLDTILGEGDTPGYTNAPIFGATGLPAFNRFMHSPDFEPIYYRTLQHLLDTTFSKAEFDLTIDQTLGDFVPASVIARMKSWMDGRRAYVRSQIAPFVSSEPTAMQVTISGEQRSPTPLTSAILSVAGAGETQYRFSLNGGPFGATNSIGTPIVLTGLANGSTNVIAVIVADTNGVWQTASNATLSKAWIVNTNWPGVRINEVLANNVTAFDHFGTFPDAIELYNEGRETADLSGLRLTDTITSPDKFTFPNGTTLAPGAYLVVIANNDDGTPGFHTGFAFNQNGEGVFLFDSGANGGALLDSVEFGLQLADLSIGRIGDGGEFVLTQPTFGTNNVAQPLGDSDKLKINEWLASEFAASASDFVELYNPEPLPVSLGGLYFTDNPIGQPARQVITPLTFIGAKDFRLFRADGDPQQGADHLDFKLASEQGLIALLAPDLDVIDLVLYGPQRTDVSQGRSPDGANTIVFFPTPTPGAPNPNVTACTVVSTDLTLMSFTNVWKYDQTENLDGIDWQTSAFDDSAWPTGPGVLAFENNPAITPLIHTALADPRTPPPGLTSGHTYYFRMTLVLTNDLAGFTVTGTAYVDDGAILYINGTEATRIRMPAGTVVNTTWATSTPPGGDAKSADTFLIPASYFMPGTNVIAAEVHQVSSSSSDIVWGIALDASRQVIDCGPSTVVLNEVFASNQFCTNGAGRTPDWVELFNTATNAIDLSDMSLTDDPNNPRQWVFPPGSFISPGEHLVIECDDGAPPSDTNTGFGLSANGDAVYLFKRPADGGSVLDSVHFGLQPSDFSIGRVADGSGSWVLTLPTRGTANVAAGLGNASALWINEWMAHSSTNDDWLELYNPNPQPVDVSGLALTDDPSARGKSPFLPLSFIGPEGFQKLVAGGNAGLAADHVNFRLTAEGGFIGLYWPIGTQIDAVSYGPQSADVSQGRFRDGEANIVIFPETPSPGAPNFLPLDNLVINEVLSHTDPPLEDAVEIHNLSSNAVDISGWYLSNTGLNPRKFLVPSGTVVPANGYHVFYEYQFGTNTSPGSLVPFNFNSAHGDEVHLSQTDSSGELTGYRAYASFGASANGVSFGRFLTSAGEEFVAMSRRSFGVDNPTMLAQFRAGTGAANPYPLVGPVVVSEINYFPAASYNGDTNAAEFLELLNLTSNNVPLYDPAAATNTWRIAGGVNFTFPENMVMPAGGLLLIVGFDPVANAAASNWFRAAYQVPPTVPIFGPFEGSLANEGEDIQLLKPDPPQFPPHPDAGFVPYVLVEHVHYLPTAPWPTNGIGAGASLQRMVPANFGDEPLNWFAGAPSAGVQANDTDGDGLPDHWEIANGLSPNDATGANGSDGDPDGDGESNKQEFLAGTNPRNGADYLHIERVSVGDNGVRLGFRAAGGHTYSVFFSTNSPVGPWQLLGNAPRAATTATVEMLDPNATNGSRFYRLVTPASPEL